MSKGTKWLMFFDTQFTTNNSIHKSIAFSFHVTFCSNYSPAFQGKPVRQEIHPLLSPTRKVLQWHMKLNPHISISTLTILSKVLMLKDFRFGDVREQCRQGPPNHAPFKYFKKFIFALNCFATWDKITTLRTESTMSNSKHKQGTTPATRSGVTVG